MRRDAEWGGAFAFARGEGGNGEEMGRAGRDPYGEDADGGVRTLIAALREDAAVCIVVVVRLQLRRLGDQRVCLFEQAPLLAGLRPRPGLERPEHLVVPLQLLLHVLLLPAEQLDSMRRRLKLPLQRRLAVQHALKVELRLAAAVRHRRPLRLPPRPGGCRC